MPVSYLALGSTRSGCGAEYSLSLSGVAREPSAGDTRGTVLDWSRRSPEAAATAAALANGPKAALAMATGAGDGSGAGGVSSAATAGLAAAVPCASAGR